MDDAPARARIVLAELPSLPYESSVDLAGSVLLKRALAKGGSPASAVCPSPGVVDAAAQHAKPAGQTDAAGVGRSLQRFKAQQAAAAVHGSQLPTPTARDASAAISASRHAAALRAERPSGGAIASVCAAALGPADIPARRGPGARCAAPAPGRLESRAEPQEAAAWFIQAAAGTNAANDSSIASPARHLPAQQPRAAERSVRAEARTAWAAAADVHQVAAHAERLVAALQAKVHRLGGELREEIQSVSNEAAGAALTQARHDGEVEQRLALVEGNAREARKALAALGAAAAPPCTGPVSAAQPFTGNTLSAVSEAGSSGEHERAALGHLQDNALFEPCGTGGAPALQAGKWAEALAVQNQHGAAIRALTTAVEALQAPGRPPRGVPRSCSSHAPAKAQAWPLRAPDLGRAQKTQSYSLGCWVGEAGDPTAAPTSVTGSNAPDDAAETEQLGGHVAASELSGLVGEQRMAALEAAAQAAAARLAALEARLGSAEGPPGLGSGSALGIDGGDGAAATAAEAAAAAQPGQRGSPRPAAAGLQLKRGASALPNPIHNLISTTVEPRKLWVRPSMTSAMPLSADASVEPGKLWVRPSMDRTLTLPASADASAGVVFVGASPGAGGAGEHAAKGTPGSKAGRSRPGSARASGLAAAPGVAAAGAGGTLTLQSPGSYAGGRARRARERSGAGSGARTKQGCGCTIS